MECNLLFDEFPTIAETVKAIKFLSSGKTPGSDAIPAEINKAGETPVAKKMTVISHHVEKRRHPSRIQGCVNYPPIQTERESSVVASLYCQLLGRSLQRVLLNRLTEHLDQSGLLPESQC